jgi:hypothetical protein
MRAAPRPTRRLKKQGSSRPSWLAAKAEPDPPLRRAAFLGNHPRAGRHGLVVLVTRATSARTTSVRHTAGGISPPRLPPQKEANRAHARLRASGERANAQLKTWRIVRKLRCWPLAHRPAGQGHPCPASPPGRKIRMSRRPNRRVANRLRLASCMEESCRGWRSACSCTAPRSCTPPQPGGTRRTCPASANTATLACRTSPLMSPPPAPRRSWRPGNDRGHCSSTSAPTAAKMTSAPMNQSSANTGSWPARCTGASRARTRGRSWNGSGSTSWSKTAMKASADQGRRAPPS